MADASARDRDGSGALRLPWDALVRTFRSELARNPRTALWLGLIGLSLWGFLLLVLQEEIDAGREHLAALRADAVRLEAIAGDTAAARADQAQARAAALERAIWRGDGEGIVRAEFQSWLVQATRDSGLENAQIQLEPIHRPPQLGGPAGVVTLPAMVSAVFSPAALAAFLERVSTGERAVIVDALKVETVPMARIEMRLLAVARPDRPTAAVEALADGPL